MAITHFETVQQVTEQKGWPEAISGADRHALYVGLGRAYELIEAWTQAEDIYKAMIAYAQTIGAPAIECLGLNRQAALYVTGLFDPPQAIGILEQAQHLAEQTGDRRGLAETSLNLSRAARHMLDIKAAFNYGEQALALARDIEESPLIASCLLNLAYAYGAHRQWETAEAYGSEAQQRYETIGNLILAADAQRLAIGCQIQCGRSRESIATLEQALAFTQEIENVWGQVGVCRFLAGAHGELGHYGQAITYSQQALKLALVVGLPLTTVARKYLGIAQRIIMALDAAQEALLAIMRIIAEGGLDTFPDLTLSELCATYALAGDWTQAYEYAQKVVQFHAGGLLLPMGTTSWYETEALLRGEAGDLARAEVARVASIVGTNRRYQLPLLRSQAVLAQWNGDVVPAVTHLENALTLAREMELPGEAWQILGELGRLYGEQGKEVKAREAYSAAGGDD